MSLPLTGCRFSAQTPGDAGRHAADLLRLLGGKVATSPAPAPAEDCPERSPEHAVRTAMEGAALASQALACHLGSDLQVDGPALLAREWPEFATGEPGTSVGGTARLLNTADGLLAVNLARADDWDLVPAWLRLSSARRATWEDIADTIRTRSATALAARAGEIGLAVAPCPTAGSAPEDGQIRHRHPNGSVRPWVLNGSARTRRRPFEELQVIDLSALWAGPLLGSLLAQAGACVTKVEDPRRRDASRTQPSELSQHLNKSKHLVEASFDTEGQDRLAALVADADIVIESSRPRALDRLRLGPRHGLPPGRIWVSITAYGRSGPWSGRAGYGDDTAASGGLYRVDDEGPAFVGDAVADPLTGIHGAVAVLAAVTSGWAGHIDLALRDTAATVALSAGSRTRRLTQSDLAGGDECDSAPDSQQDQESSSTPINSTAPSDSRTP